MSCSPALPEGMGGGGKGGVGGAGWNGRCPRVGSGGVPMTLAPMLRRLRWRPTAVAPV